MDVVLVIWWLFFAAVVWRDRLVNKEGPEHGVEGGVLLLFTILGACFSPLGVLVGMFWGYLLVRLRQVGSGDMFILASIGGVVFRYLPHPFLMVGAIAVGAAMAFNLKVWLKKETGFPVSPYLFVALMIAWGASTL
ncbi:MAG: hypothetical protein GXN93_03270 [Candidatus Diapherotrites archaeon]|nr:hypothetical protein [Candidatus Diapherotrites archaeon]